MPEEKDPRQSKIYKMLLEVRGEEYAELYLAPEEERMKYIAWWQDNFDTENDQINDLGVPSEFFSSLHEAKMWLKKMESL
jgi:hypothetical protein